MLYPLIEETGAFTNVFTGVLKSLPQQTLKGDHICITYILSLEIPECFHSWGACMHIQDHRVSHMGTVF